MYWTTADVGTTALESTLTTGSSDSTDAFGNGSTFRVASEFNIVPVQERWAQTIAVDDVSDSEEAPVRRPRYRARLRLSPVDVWRA